jgi:hypothetical protein
MLGGVPQIAELLSNAQHCSGLFRNQLLEVNHVGLQAVQRLETGTSVITSKPAIRDRLKTGHTRSDRDRFI